jgi:hypothetical protein
LSSAADQSAILILAALRAELGAPRSANCPSGGRHRAVAEPLQTVADPIAAELEVALALRRSGADPKALRRALRRIEELLDE